MILLRDIWQIENVVDYKVHFAKYNREIETHPLDDWVSDPQIWQRWQEYKSTNPRSVFNRRFIFSLMQFYHETDIWLFGGVFEVLEDQGDQFVVELTEQGQNFIGRLKLRAWYPAMNVRPTLEKHYYRCQNGIRKILKVQEILREPYSGRSFPGYENIDLSFAELEALVRNDRPDWRVPLTSMKGVYLISDKKTDEQYVGATYGDMGIWQRWKNYVETGHGGNAALQELVQECGIDYCRKYFQFALLEHRQAHTSVDVIQEREKWWKNILRTRLNRN